MKFFGNPSRAETDDQSLDENDLLINSLQKKNPEEMTKLAQDFLTVTRVERLPHEYIRKGRFLARESKAFENEHSDARALTADEMEALKREDRQKGTNP